MQAEEMALEQGPVTVGDMDGEVNEAPLSAVEEEAMETNQLAKEKAELMDLFDNVLGMKALTDNFQVQSALFKVIDGNIAALKDQLEIEEKPREVVKAQGKLEAYKRMRDFPASAVEMFNSKLFAMRTDLALLIEDDEFINKVRVDFDPTSHKIDLFDPRNPELDFGEEEFDEPEEM